MNQPQVYIRPPLLNPPPSSPHLTLLGCHRALRIYPPASGERYGGIYSPLFFFSSESDLQTASFLTEFSVTYLYSQLTPVCQASAALLRGTSGVGGKSIPKGLYSLLTSISPHLNTTPHCDSTDFLRDMYSQCLALSDFSITFLKEKERKEQGKREIVSTS